MSDWEIEKRLENEKDAEIARLKAEIAHLRDEVLVSLRLSQKQLEVNSEKDAEIERLKVKEDRLKKLINKLCDMLSRSDLSCIQGVTEFVQRAREAAK